MKEENAGKGPCCVVFFSVPGETYVNGRYEERDPGNTKVAATILSRELSCPIMEIVPKDLYSRKYRGQVERAKKEWVESHRPALKSCPIIAEFQDIYLCYPNWCGTIPMAVATFLESNDWKGKTIHPLCTNEGSGMGTSMELMATCAPDAVIGEGLPIRGANVKSCRDAVKDWIS
jgi:flavodoxin